MASSSAASPRPETADYDKAVRDHRIDLLYLGDTRGADRDDRRARLPADRKCRGRAGLSGWGLGRHLLAYAEALAAAGHSRVRLFTNKLMEANQRLYARLGYSIDGEEVFPAPSP